MIDFMAHHIAENEESAAMDFIRNYASVKDLRDLFNAMQARQSVLATKMKAENARNNAKKD